MRLLYLHVPTTWIAYLAFFVTAVASVLWLVPRTRRPTWDLLAGASAEVGVIFTGLTLVLGSLWGRPVVGHLVGVGRPAHDDRDPVLPLPRLPRVAAHGRDRRRAGQAVRDRRAHRVRRRADRALLGQLVADAAPDRHRVQRRAESRRSTARWHSRWCSPSARSRLLYGYLVLRRLRLAELEEGLEEREVERAIAERAARRTGGAGLIRTRGAT